MTLCNIAFNAQSTVCHVKFTPHTRIVPSVACFPCGKIILPTIFENKKENKGYWF